MVRFYGVLRPDDFEKMDCEDFDLYWFAMERIEAQEVLTKMNVSDYPHLNQKSREKIHREIFKKAYPTDSSKPITTDQLASILGRSVNG